MASEILENLVISSLESRISVQYSSIAKTAPLYRSLQQRKAPITTFESSIKDATTKGIQYQLLWLWHAYWSCKSKAICPLLQCKLAYEAIYHLKNCSSGYDCPFPFCSPSQKAIAHWKQCIHSDCYICVSLKIFTAASHNKLSVVNALKLILNVLGYRIIKYCGQAKIDVLEQVVEILKSRIINERKITSRTPEAIEWLVIRNLFDYLKYKITTDQLDLYLLLEVTIVSKYKTIVHDCSGSPYAEANVFRKFEDKDFEPLVKAFGFKIIKEQAPECEHLEIDILKRVFIAFQSRLNYKAEIPFRFFNALELTAGFDNTDCNTMNQILHSFGYTVTASMAIKNADKSKKLISKQACDIVNRDIMDQEDKSELLEPDNMRLIIPFLAHCTIIPNSLTLSDVDPIRQVLDAFKQRITTDEKDDCKFSQGKILKRVINALKYQDLYQNTKIYGNSQKFMDSFKEQLSDVYFVKSMLDDLGCIIMQDKVSNFKISVIEIVKKTFDDLDWMIIRDEEDRIENLP